MNLKANREGLRQKRWQDGWLNDEVGYGSISHDSRGNLIDGLGNPIKEAEEVVEEEEEQERDEVLKLKLKQEQEDIQWHSDFLQLMEHIRNLKYISHCADTEAQRIF